MTGEIVGKIIQARINDETEEMLEILKKQGFSESKAIREGIKLLSLTVVQKQRSKSEIVGLGKFESKVEDLGSNKKHLRGFGRG